MGASKKEYLNLSERLEVEKEKQFTQIENNLKEKEMPVIKKSESFPERPVIIFVYGDAGVSKTSLANTCNNPILNDFDRGADRSYNRPDTLVFTNGWSEVEAEENAGTYANYDTIVIDTAKACLDDFLMAYVTEKDYKLKTNKLKAYGEIGDQFKLFINKRRIANQDIFVIAHAKYEKDGDNTKITPDVTGQSLQLLLRIADQVGFMTVENGKRTIQFNPTDKTVGKNVAQLPKLILPLHTDADWKGFADREIISKVKEAISKQTEEQQKALQELEGWYAKVDALTKEELNDFTKEAGSIEEVHIQKQVRSYFGKHVKKLGLKFNKETSEFEEVVAEVAE